MAIWGHWKTADGNADRYGNLLLSILQTGLDHEVHTD
jgi:hypothetical protein